MSLDYFLALQNNYYKMLTDIRNVITMYEDILNDFACVHPNDSISPIPANIDTDFVLNEIKKDARKKISFYEEECKKLLEMKNICDVEIYRLCNHEYITDNIDITPDKSMAIDYCKICESMRP
jgi:hypothetical protein